MKKVAKKLQYCLIELIMLTSSCVRDEMPECASSLNIVYDYNMEYVDLFHKQVTFFSLFVFDAETGVFQREIKQAQNPFPEKYTVQIPPEMHGKKYTFVVWAGLNADSYDFQALIPGQSVISDLKVKVKGYEEQLVDRRGELEPLWHGILRNVVYMGDEDEIKTIYLVKDTKKFRLILQTLDPDEVIDMNQFDVMITSPDGWYDYTNLLLDNNDTPITYKPYYTANDPDVGGIAEMNSLRLMNDGRNNRLIITEKSSGEDILNIALDKYIQALKLLQFSSMPLQEYMDREDHYSILVFMQKTGHGGEDPVNANWIASNIKINEWMIRDQQFIDE